MTQQVLSYFHVGVAILLGAAILLQQKGQGLSGAFGGEGGFYRTKRGFEKILLICTIILSVLFIIMGVVRIVVTPGSGTSTSAPPASTDSVSIPFPGLEKNEQIPPLNISDIEVQTEPASQ